MSKKIKLTATTPVGTFTRTTARTYTHVVVARQDQAAARERAYSATAHDTKTARSNFAFYTHQAELGVEGLKAEHAAKWRYVKPQAEFIRQHMTAKSLAGLGLDGYLATLRERAIESHEKTVREGGFQFGAINWCGRLDLAQKEASKAQRQGWIDVQIFPVDEHGPNRIFKP